MHGRKKNNTMDPENIYSSVEVIEERELDPQRNKIEDYLYEQEHPVTAREIAKATGYNTKGSQVELRKAITELIEIDKVPIISLSNGFMIAHHPNQMRHYAKRLRERIMGIERRARVCEEIANDMERTHAEE